MIEDDILEILRMFYPEYKVRKKLPFHLSKGSLRQPNSLYNMLQKWDKDIVIKMFGDIAAKRSTKGTLQFYTDKYGEEEGTKRYKEKNSKLSVSVEALQRNGKSMEEIEDIRSTHKRKSAHNEDNFIRVYGEEGNHKHQEWKQKSRTRTNRCVEYWLERGCGEEEAIAIISKRQTRDFTFFKKAGYTDEEYKEFCKRKTYGISKQGYVERYGEEEGSRLFLYDRTKSSNIQYYIDKYGEEIGTQIYREVITKRIHNYSGGVSKIQKTFAEQLYNTLPNDILCYFLGEPITKSYWIKHNSNECGIKWSIPDIRILNILIEFDGDFWHSFEHIKNRDNTKDMLNTNLGYYTIRVKEKDYRSDPYAVINHVLQEITTHINMTFHP